MWPAIDFQCGSSAAVSGPGSIFSGQCGYWVVFKLTLSLRMLSSILSRISISWCHSLCFQPWSISCIENFSIVHGADVTARISEQHLLCLSLVTKHDCKSGTSLLSVTQAGKHSGSSLSRILPTRSIKAAPFSPVGLMKTLAAARKKWLIFERCCQLEELQNLLWIFL